jgi:isopentenyl-diphosphate delta-isomerase
MEFTERVILVDGSDRQVGTSEKLAAHRGGGRLHRSFSIFLVDSDGRVLLQQRSVKKYHFKGLWSNACCGHPRPDESVADAAVRRLSEEVGVVTSLRPLYSFIYCATDRHAGYTEREYDHVFLGCSDGQLDPCPEEVDDLKWTSPLELARDMRFNPGRYTPWFLLAAPRVLSAGLSHECGRGRGA